jgi:hypothetical protein
MEHLMKASDQLTARPSGGEMRLPARLVCERYRIVRRTLDRWIENEALGFPRPIVINKRRYFREHELEAWERRRAQAA